MSSTTYVFGVSPSRRVSVDLALVLVVVAGLAGCFTSSRRVSLAIPLAEQAVDQRERAGFVSATSAPRPAGHPSPSAHPPGPLGFVWADGDGMTRHLLQPRGTSTV